MAAPKTSLLKNGAEKLKWNDSAQHTFEKLKKAFSTAPILHHPDPERQFIVDGDASESGVGNVLLQHFGEKSKLFPVAFFSKKLTTAEHNYDVDNRELLEIKLPLEE